MIYDCFTFFNELDLLTIRLNELDEVVDKFVLVESTRTFQGKEKPLHYALNKDRFAAFNDKIVHVVVDEFPDATDGNAWNMETHQRNAIMDGLVGCSPDDDILIGDVDELPRPEKVVEVAGGKGMRIFRQRMFYYYLNCLNATERSGANYAWNGTQMVRYGDIRSTIQELRDLSRLMETRFHPKLLNRTYWYFRMAWEQFQRGHKASFITDGGWHFSYLGGVDRIIEKIESFAHTEYNAPKYKDRVALERAIASGADIFGRDFQYNSVPIDSTFPKFVQQNKERLSQLIAPVKNSESA